MLNQQVEFEDRIARIQGPDQGAWRDPALGVSSPRQVGQKAAGGNAQISVLAGLIIGGLMALAALWVRYRVLGLSDFGGRPDMVLLYDASMALVAAFALRELLAMKTVSHLFGIAIGIGAVLVGIHNLVWVWPEPFLQVFSTEWVTATKDSAPLGSVLFRGSVFAI